MSNCWGSLSSSTQSLIDPSVTWPGWRALIPVTGTALIIAASNQGSLLTRPAVLQWLGNRSYSLYLWHWPIVAALVFVELRQEVSATIVGLLVTVVLGHISYVFIENKSKGVLAKQGTWAAYGTIFVALMLVALPSHLIQTDDGVPTRTIAKQVSKILKDAAVRNPRIRECFINGKKTVPECSYGGTELGAIVIGDSHAAAVIRAVERSLPNKNLNVLDWTRQSCLTISGLKFNDDPDNRCSEFLKYTLEKQKSLPANAPIIIISRAAAYLFGPNEPDRQAEVPVPGIYIDKPFSSRSPEFFAELREDIISTACEFAKTRPVTWYVLRQR